MWVSEMPWVKQVRSPDLCFLKWPHTAYGRNLSGVYSDLPMPRGTQCLSFGDWSEMGKACGPNSPFSVKLPRLFDYFITSWELELLTYLLDHRLSRDLWSMLLLCTVCYLGPKLGLVVRKNLASLGVESLEARWSSSSKSISEVKGYSDWKCNEFLPLITLALSGPEEAFQWLLSNSLDILSVESVGMNWKDWP